MAILIGRETKVIIVGVKSSCSLAHAHAFKQYGTQVAGIVLPGSGGSTLEGLQFFDTVDEVLSTTAANLAVVDADPQFTADLILECVDGQIPLIVCLSRGIPVRDILRIKEILNHSPSRMIGPSCAGLITPGECLAGLMPSDSFMPGRIGMMSRSGTLLYEVAYQLTLHDLGQSTCVCLGADPVLGSDYVDVLKLFQADKETDLIILLGEIGGDFESEAAKYIRRYISKPVVSYIAGSLVPREKVIGHDSAIIMGNSDTAEKKFEIMEKCGVNIVKSSDRIVAKVKEVLHMTYK